MRETLKPVRFLGDSLKQLRDFPDGARKQAGVELHRLQLGLEPLDWKPMSASVWGGGRSAFATMAERFG